MKFSILSWNIEHFKGNEARVKKAADHIKQFDPDVFGLLEIENMDVLNLMKDHFPDYNFNITDGPETQEILVSYRQDKFDQVAFTQKREFKAYNPYLRPGALLTLRSGSIYYNILFLHMDSGTDAPAFGNRVEMFDHVWKLKKAIDKMASKSNLVVLGDFNTMGMQYPKKSQKNPAFSGLAEIDAVGIFAAKSNMVLLEKEHDATWTSTTMTSDLDHVLASDHLMVANAGNKPDGTPFQVRVSGWQELSGSAKKTFVDTISDHCSLYIEIK